MNILAMGFTRPIIRFRGDVQKPSGASDPGSAQPAAAQSRRHREEKTWLERILAAIVFLSVFEEKTHLLSYGLHSVRKKSAFDNVCNPNKNEQDVAAQLFRVFRGRNNHLPPSVKQAFETILEAQDRHVPASEIKQIGHKSRPGRFHPKKQEQWDTVIVPRYFRILRLVLELDQRAQTASH